MFAGNTFGNVKFCSVFPLATQGYHKFQYSRFRQTLPVQYLLFEEDI